MKAAFIGAGSNLGQRQEQICRALEWTAEEIGPVEQTSALYQTSPWGNIDQPDYLNQVWQIRTRLDPFQLMQALLMLERRANRERAQQWGARTLDLDLLLYEDYCIRTEALTLPHPRMHLRNFVLVPFAEIAPGQMHPAFHKTIRELLLESEDHETVAQWKGRCE